VQQPPHSRIVAAEHHEPATDRKRERRPQVREDAHAVQNVWDVQHEPIVKLVDWQKREIRTLRRP
jgi:hypothetical protein